MRNSPFAVLAALLPAAASATKFESAHETFAKKASEGPEGTPAALYVILAVAALVLAGVILQRLRRR